MSIVYQWRSEWEKQNSTWLYLFRMDVPGHYNWTVLVECTAPDPQTKTKNQNFNAYWQEHLTKIIISLSFVSLCFLYLPKRNFTGQLIGKY